MGGGPPYTGLASQATGACSAMHSARQFFYVRVCVSPGTAHPVRCKSRFHGPGRFSPLNTRSPPMPRFSLIVPTAGRTTEVAELLKSIVAQNRTDVELIVV